MVERDEIFAQFLFDAGILSRAQLESVSNDDTSLARTLVERGMLSEEDVTRAFGKCLSIPFVGLAPADISREALFTIPETFSRAHNVVAYAKEGEQLFVALIDLHNLEALEQLRLPFRVKVRLTDRQSMKMALLRYQQALAEQYMLHIRAQNSPSLVIDSLVLHALNQKAVTVHLEPDSQGLHVRYRVAGVLRSAMMLPLRTAVPIIERLKSLANISSLTSSDGRFVVQKGDERVPIHIHVAKGIDGESVVLTFSHNSSLESFGFHGRGLEYLHQALERHSGLILVCGPEDSSTELQGTLAGLATRHDRKVVTAKEHVRAALRQDPDVLVVNFSDTETTALAVHAANRGMLVIASMQANSAAEALAYLHSIVPPRTLASTFLVAISTRNVRKLCARSERARLSREEIDALEARGVRFSAILAALKEEGKISVDMQWKDVPFFKPVSCPECERGYIGRTALQEVLPTSMALCDLIIAEASATDIEAQMRAEEVFSLLEDGVYKAAQGQATVEEVLSLEV